ncbi:major facilitator superfamily protein [Hirsutella rhossiliensis]|uniref:Major facilitator superfamily domain-containing protein n=1 Tax=Hirsutella rhossiliensis TaxID=111463 RepID=A0A9P8N458_9HYPO|nr:major facilitator superfamily domain-containing protein [Hirsutella rhossiliensis]KAH0966262.1 major facilitator superfamily domain-containing protein [Hirsutella rhossiliensis]
MDQNLEQSLFNPHGPLVTRLESQSVRGSTAAIPQTFYRNLEEALEVRRASKTFYSIVQDDWGKTDMVDLCSNDLLSLSATGMLTAEYLAELARHPGFATTSGGSRMVDGNYPYLDQTEKEVAAFHGFEAGVMLNSGFDANVAIWTAIPRPGDVMLYDEASHASTHDGMRQSLTTHKIEFRHNDVESFRSTLVSIFESHPLVRQARRTVLVSVESVYSMDGDVCPLRELIEVAKDVSRNQGNVQFVVDEAHSTGMIGPGGRGLVCELGLEKDVAVVLHSFAKGLGSHGAIIVGSSRIRSTIVNFARSFQYTTAPPFPLVALVKAGYTLLTDGRAREKQENIQFLMGLFFEEVTSHALWHVAQRKGILSIPLSKGWEERSFFTHVITLWTRQRCTYWLYFHLLFSSFSVMPVEHPVVPAGQSRLKVTVHGGNTEAQIQGLVKAIYVWVEEMLAAEETGEVTTAAAKVYAWMKREKLSGFVSLVRILRFLQSSRAPNESQFSSIAARFKGVMTTPNEPPSASDAVKLETASAQSPAGPEAGACHNEAVLTPEQQVSNDQKKTLGFKMSVLSLVIMCFIVSLDGTILAVAIPVIAQDLNGTTLEAFWASIAFILAVVITQPVYTNVSNVLGRLIPLYISFGLFMAGSIVFALANSMGVLIGGRVIQGLGAGGLDVFNEIILADITTLKERPMYLGLMAVPVAVGSILGPILGGMLAQYATWRWIGWINLPVSVVDLVLVFFFLKLKTLQESFREKALRLDWIGLVLFTIGCTLTATPIAWAGVMYPWSSWRTILPLCLGIAVLAAFGWYESRPQEPVFPPWMFKSRTSSFALLASFLHGVLVYSIIFFAPLYYQAVFLKAPMQSAISTLPLACCSVVFGIIGAVIVEVTRKYRLIILISWILAAVGCGILTFWGDDASLAMQVTFQIILGIGTGNLFSVLNLPMQASVPNADDMGLAAGVLVSFRLFGALLDW